MHKAPCALGLLLAICTAGLLPAQEPEVLLRRQLYSRGVHSYFSGDYDQAVALLDQAVELGSKDPRVYYFRALAILGTTDEDREKKSLADIQAAAKMETADVDGFYNIGLALERVQGAPRLVIEDERRTARRRAELRIQEDRGRRYNRIKQAEPDVTLPAPTPDPEQPFNPFEEKAGEPAAAPMSEPMPEEPAPEDPAPEDPAPAAEPAAEEPAAAAPAAEDAAEDNPANEAPPADAPKEDP